MFGLNNFIIITVLIDEYRIEVHFVCFIIIQLLLAQILSNIISEFDDRWANPCNVITQEVIVMQYNTILYLSAISLTDE